MSHLHLNKAEKQLSVIFGNEGRQGTQLLLTALKQRVEQITEKAEKKKKKKKKKEGNRKGSEGG